MDFYKNVSTGNEIVSAYALPGEIRLWFRFAHSMPISLIVVILLMDCLISTFRLLIYLIWGEADRYVTYLKGNHFFIFIDAMQSVLVLPNQSIK